MRIIIFITIIFFTISQLFGQSNIKLASIFSDNMVLQQNSNVSIWGKGTPEAEVEIKTNWGVNTNFLVNSDSSWSAKVETPSAGGPYTINISQGENKTFLKNVMIGEVWLCSGQSNMEMPLFGWLPGDPIDDSEMEINNANYSDIRLFTVSRKVSATKLEDVTGEWQECSPQTIPDFSAAAYFFGKELYKELNVPIGLIHSSWGGTPAEAWTDAKFLTDVPGYQEFATNLEEMVPKQKEFNKRLESHRSIEIIDVSSSTEFVDIDLDDTQCSSVTFEDTSWMEMQLPTTWESTRVGNFDGVIWFRKSIELPKSWDEKELVLSIGPIDDMDITFFDGTKIGGYESAGHWQTPREYTISSDLVKAGINTIAIRVIDTQGGGGIFGKEKA